MNMPQNSVSVICLEHFKSLAAENSTAVAWFEGIQVMTDEHFANYIPSDATNSK